jgi:DNA-binding MarR family transcriptional regulator
LPETLAFMQLLWTVDHGLRSLSKQMHARLGLTGPQRLVLRLVGRFREVAPSELAELLQLDRGTMTGIVERLVDRKLLIRAANSTDRRRYSLRLSAKGRRMDRETSGTVEACVRKTLTSLPQAKIDAASAVLRRLAVELTQE